MELDTCREYGAKSWPLEFAGSSLLSARGARRGDRSSNLSRTGANICRSEPLCEPADSCWHALRVETQRAKSTGSFVFTQRVLDIRASLALAEYLRDGCCARFVEISGLGGFPEASLSIAAAVQQGLRGTRSLVLDGNDLGADPTAFQEWCSAFEAHPGLQHISMRDTELNTDSAHRFAELLLRNTVISSVDLGLNRIGDSGVIALADAVSENGLIMDVNVDGNDADAGACRELASALARNRERFAGRKGTKLKTVHDLRRAQAESLAASILLSSHSLGGAVGQQLPLAPKVLALDGEPSTRFDEWSGLGDALDAPCLAGGGQDHFDPKGVADGVHFDAGHGPTEELLLRSEAHWRYNATDMEMLQELRRAVADGKAQRLQEKARGDDILARIADAKTAFRLQATPTEQHIIGLKESLAEEVEATKTVLRAGIQGRTALVDAQRCLEHELRETSVHALCIAKAEHGLKFRALEVADEVEARQRELHLLEASAEALEAENEKFRRRLHAARFETEGQRFVPSWVSMAGTGPSR